MINASKKIINSVRCLFTWLRNFVDTKAQTHHVALVRFKYNYRET